MLTIIKRLLGERRDRQEMLNLRAAMGDMMRGIHTLLFLKDEEMGVLVRAKAGWRLRQLLENRFGVRGPDFLTSVHTDYELEQEGKLLDKLRPEGLAQLVTELGRLAERVPLERGDPEEWEDSGEATKNLAEVVALRLLSGWLNCKLVVHTSMNRKVVKEAQDWERIHYNYIQSQLRLLRGEEPRFGKG